MNAESGGGGWGAFEAGIPDVDVYLVGLGLQVPNDLTLEAIGAMRLSDEILAIPAVDLKEFGIREMKDLSSLYGKGKSRRDTYHEMAEIVLEECQREKKVSFVTYGSAVVGTRAAHIVGTEGQRRGLEVHLCRTASSYEGMWFRLGIDPFMGFETWEASMFVRYGVQPNRTANLLLTGVSLFGIEDDVSGRKCDLGGLWEYLGHFYGDDQPMALIRLAQMGIPERLEWFKLGAAPAVLEADMTSLVISRVVPERWRELVEEEDVSGEGWAPRGGRL